MDSTGRDQQALTLKVTEKGPKRKEEAMKYVLDWCYGVDAQDILLKPALNEKWREGP